MESKDTKQSAVSRFSKEQILASDRFSNRRDALSVCLEDKKYTINEVEKTLDKFMKEKVR